MRAIGQLPPPGRGRETIMPPSPSQISSPVTRQHTSSRSQSLKERQAASSLICQSRKQRRCQPEWGSARPHFCQQSQARRLSRSKRAFVRSLQRYNAYSSCGDSPHPPLRSPGNPKTEGRERGALVSLPLSGRKHPSTRRGEGHAGPRDPQLRPLCSGPFDRSGDPHPGWHLERRHPFHG